MKAPKPHRDQVLALLDQHDELSFDDLYKRIDDIDGKSVLSTLLHAMKKAGEVAQSGPRQPYTLPGKRGGKNRPATVTSPGDAKRHAASLLKTGRERASRAVADNGARAVLAKNVADTQAALDEYVARIADPRILGSLKVSRDGARDALAAFDEQQGVGA